MRASNFVSILGIAAGSLATTTARAQHGEPEYPLSYVERPLTLPRSTLAPELELDITRFPFTTAAGTTGPIVIAGMQVGASFGITRNIEVGAIVAPIQLNNDAGYGGEFLGGDGLLAEPSVFATFRFFHGEAVEIGARLRLQLVVPRGAFGAGAILEPSLPILVHIGKIARFDAEVGVPLVLLQHVMVGPGGAVSRTTTIGSTAGLDVPLRLAFNILAPLHVGLSTGVTVENFEQAGPTTRIPLGFFAGYAVGERRPIVDIDPFFSWIYFLTPAGPFNGDKVNPGLYVVGVNARGYIYF